MKEYSPTEKRRIYAFAVTWESIYRNYMTVPFVLFEEDVFVGEGMRILGFDENGGVSVTGSGAFGSGDEPENLLPADIQTLGNAILSRWRFWTDWKISGPMEDEDYEWFAEAFRCLAQLAKL